MRSRDVRPFTVEFKNKRRSPLTPPTSLWGGAAELLRPEPDRGKYPLPDSRMLELIASSVEVKPVPEIQPKRILPDLRTMEVAVHAEPVAVRVSRTRRKTEGNTMLQDAERQEQHQMEPAPVAPELQADPAPASQIELYASDQACMDEAGASALPSNGDIVVPQAASSDAPIVVSQQGHGRARRWLRKADELPHGERWKRRLPEVCR